MSHYCVFVIGEDIKKQLQPYHEYECTGTNDEYVVDVDITEQVKADIVSQGSLEDGLGYHGLNHVRVEDEAHVDRKDVHKYGYAVVRDGQLIKAVDRTNPNKKWDWWVVGGRYSDRLMLKDGTRVNFAKWGELDIKGMREAKVKVFLEWRARMRAIIGDAPQPDSWLTVLERNKVVNVPEEEAIASARKEYWAQPAMDRFKHHGTAEAAFIEDSDVQQLYWDDAKFEDHARRQGLSAFAVLKDGKWHQRGEMLMLGLVAEEKDGDDWERERDSLLESLSPDTLITVVDCHI